MKLFKHKKNDRKESIKTKAEQATVVFRISKQPKITRNIQA